MMDKVICKVCSERLDDVYIWHYMKENYNNYAVSQWTKDCVQGQAYHVSQLGVRGG